MKIRKSVIDKYVALIISFIISFALIISADKISIHIAGMIIFSVVAIIQVKFDLLHPYCWFSGFFCLYSIGYPILYAFGYHGVTYSKEIMIYQLLALFICLLFITPIKRLSLSNIENYDFRVNIGVFNKIIYVVIILVIVLTVFYVYQSGFLGKDDIYASGNVFLIMAFRLPLVLSMLYSVSVISFYAKNKKIPMRQILLVSIALLAITLFSGERDFIFRFLIISVMILWFFKLLKIWHMLIVLPAFSLLLPLSSAFKYYFLRGEISQNRLGLLYSFLAGEFESSARNLQVLVNNSNSTEGALGFVQIIKDVISVFNSNFNSPSVWFGETFYAGRQTQYGFSLVGEGYVIGGAIGIVVLFAIIGVLIGLFYKNAQRNIFTLSSYFYFITVVIYSLRGDFSTILSAVIKQIGFVVLVLYIMEKVGKSNIKCPK